MKYLHQSGIGAKARASLVGRTHFDKQGCLVPIDMPPSGKTFDAGRNKAKREKRKGRKINFTSSSVL